MSSSSELGCEGMVRHSLPGLRFWRQVVYMAEVSYGCCAEGLKCMMYGFVISIWVVFTLFVFGMLVFGMECSPSEILVRHFVCLLCTGLLPLRTSFRACFRVY